MDFSPAGVANWWRIVEERTSWLELVAAFVSILAAVWLALWLERRQFAVRLADQRKADHERDESMRAEREARESERRRELVVQTFDIITEIQNYGTGGVQARYLGDSIKNANGARRAIIFKLDKLGGLFAMQDEPGSREFGIKFAEALLQLFRVKDSRALSWDQEVIGQVQGFLIEWQQGRATLAEFQDSAIYHQLTSETPTGDPSHE